MSSCCLTASAESGRAWRRAGRSVEEPRGREEREQSRDTDAAGGSRGVVSQSEESTVFLRPSDQRGTASAEVVARWAANAPLAMIDQYMPNLKMMHAIGLEVGLQDGLAASNEILDETLTRFDVPHIYETYEGNHTNKVPERFEEKVLPFFSKNLSAAPGKRK